LAVQRLRTLQEKKEAQAKLARRDVAALLERAKVETARIKVEARAYLSSADLLVLLIGRMPQSSTTISILNSLRSWNCIANY
jgi:hypothetical protein